MAPQRSVKDVAVEASGALIRAMSSQPIMLGFLIVTLLVLYAAWQLRVEARKLEHLEQRFLLERCLPVPKGAD